MQLNTLEWQLKKLTLSLSNDSNTPLRNSMASFVSSTLCTYKNNKQISLHINIENIIYKKYIENIPFIS